MKWEKYKLSSLVEKPISGEWGNGEGSIKVIRSTNFTNDGVLDLKDVVSRNIPQNKVDKKQLKKGDVIIEKSGGSPTQPVGRVVHFLVDDQIYLCNNFTSVLRPKNNVHPRYLFWCLFSGYSKGSSLKYQNKTTGIINLQLERYCNEFEVPLPPLHIQEQIADTLDKADALRRKDQELLQKYDELAQAIFYDMFGDPVRNEKGWKPSRLMDICLQITDGTHFSPPAVESGVPYITAKHLKKWGLDFFHNPTYVDEVHHQEIYARCKPQKGDVLYIKDGATTGLAAINEYDFEFSMLSSLALIKPDTSVLNNVFLKYCVSSSN
jgi:type I restriction enzyme S subunit